MSILGHIGHALEHAGDDVKHLAEDLGHDARKLGHFAGHEADILWHKIKHLEEQVVNLKALGQFVKGELNIVKHDAESLGHTLEGFMDDAYHSIIHAFSSLNELADILKDAGEDFAKLMSILIKHSKSFAKAILHLLHVLDHQGLDALLPVERITHLWSEAKAFISHLVDLAEGAVHGAEHVAKLSDTAVRHVANMGRHAVESKIQVVDKTLFIETCTNIHQTFEQVINRTGATHFSAMLPELPTTKTLEAIPDEVWKTVSTTIQLHKFVEFEALVSNSLSKVGQRSTKNEWVPWTLMSIDLFRKALANTQRFITLPIGLGLADWIDGAAKGSAPMGIPEVDGQGDAGVGVMATLSLVNIVPGALSLPIILADLATAIINYLVDTDVIQTTKT